MSHFTAEKTEEQAILSREHCLSRTGDCFLELSPSELKTSLAQLGVLVLGSWTSL